MAAVAHNEPAVRLLMTIPGVDYLAALSLLAAIGDITRFPTAKQLASYFGLVSRVSQSGDHCYTGPITKRGRSHGRWIAIQCAQHLAKARGPLHHFYLRIKKRNPLRPRDGLQRPAARVCGKAGCGKTARPV